MFPCMVTKSIFIIKNYLMLFRDIGLIDICSMNRKNTSIEREWKMQRSQMLH